LCRINSQWQRIAAGCYTPRMTLVEVTYELRAALSAAHLARLGQFANTYGLRKFRVDEEKKLLTFEYDASRLKGTQVMHVLGLAGIPIARVQAPA
jgi:hypothetical protein